MLHQGEETSRALLPWLDVTSKLTTNWVIIEFIKRTLPICCEKYEVCHKYTWFTFFYRYRESLNSAGFGTNSHCIIWKNALFEKLHYFGTSKFGQICSILLKEMEKFLKKPTISVNLDNQVRYWNRTESGIALFETTLTGEPLY